MKGRVILADPPWSYNNRHDNRSDNPDRKTKFGIGVASRYSNGVMSHKDICGIDVASISTDDAYLFLWTTWTHMAEALEVINAWGFTYKTAAFIWVKTAGGPSGHFMGPGRYTFSNSEPCLFARREPAPCWHPNTGWRPGQIIQEPHPRGADGKIIHSRKPAIVQKHIRRWLGPHIEGGEFVELFATEPKSGWRTLGHAVSGHDIRDEIADWWLQTAGSSALVLPGAFITA